MVKYLEENAAATHISVTAEEIEMLDKAFPVNAAHGARYPAMQMSVTEK